MSDDNSEKEFTKRDFVYAGRRILRSNAIGHSVFPIGDDGELMDEKLYKLKLGTGMVVGGIYRGAEFSDNSSRGVDSFAKYQRMLDDPDRVIAWESEDRVAQLDLANVRREKNAKLNSQLETALQPIREAIHNANARGDWAAAAAIRQAVAALLAKPLTKSEAE
jgi:hypothetical protein